MGVKSTPAKLEVNVDLFTSILKAQRCLNVHSVIKHLIETSMQLGMYFIEKQESSLYDLDVESLLLDSVGILQNSD